MFTLSRWLMPLAVSMVLLQACSDSSDSQKTELVDPAIAQAESVAVEINMRQQAAWNSLDAEGEAAVNHYPFIRISRGTLVVLETYETYRDIVEAISLPNLVATEWDHTA